MTEGMVSLGVAATTQDGNPHRKAKCLRYQGKWKILHSNWDVPVLLRMETTCKF